MKREYTEELISAYLDGELTADEQSAVEAELRESAECRQAVDDFRQLREQLQRLPRESLDADFGARVLRAAERAMLTDTRLPPVRQVAVPVAAAAQPAAPQPAAPLGGSAPGDLMRQQAIALRRWRIAFACSSSLAAVLLVVLTSGSLLDVGPRGAIGMNRPGVPFRSDLAAPTAGAPESSSLSSKEASESFAEYSLDQGPTRDAVKLELSESEGFGARGRPLVENDVRDERRPTENDFLVPEGSRSNDPPASLPGLPGAGERGAGMPGAGGMGGAGPTAAATSPPAAPRAAAGSLGGGAKRMAGDRLNETERRKRLDVRGAASANDSPANASPANASPANDSPANAPAAASAAPTSGPATMKKSGADSSLPTETKQNPSDKLQDRVVGERAEPTGGSPLVLLRMQLTETAARRQVIKQCLDANNLGQEAQQLGLESDSAPIVDEKSRSVRGMAKSVPTPPLAPVEANQVEAKQVDATQSGAKQVDTGKSQKSSPSEVEVAADGEAGTPYERVQLANSGDYALFYFSATPQQIVGFVEQVEKDAPQSVVEQRVANLGGAGKPTALSLYNFAFPVDEKMQAIETEALPANTAQGQAAKGPPAQTPTGTNLRRNAYPLGPNLNAGSRARFLSRAASNLDSLAARNNQAHKPLLPSTPGPTGAPAPSPESNIGEKQNLESIPVLLAVEVVGDPEADVGAPDK